MGRTVMVVDDNPDDVELTRCLLEEIAPEVRLVAVEGGEAALALLRESREAPALILMDLKMPGMSGVEAMVRLRADERFRDIPVVITSHSTLTGDREKALEAGARAYVHKAFDLDEFGRTLRLELDRWLND